MKICSWNVNSIRQRLPLVKLLIEQHDPDVILLQELKCTEEQFPFECFAKYHIALHCQKAYNGVAIISKQPIQKITKNLSNEARYIQGYIEDICIGCVYAPNGGQHLHPTKWQYRAAEFTEEFMAIQEQKNQHKKNFLLNLIESVQSLINQNTSAKIILGGDFNIPRTNDDIKCLDLWAHMPSTSPEMRNILEKLINILPDASPNNTFTYIDYRRPYDQVRIDYFLTNCLATKQTFYPEFRKMHKPSDHIPIMLEVM